MHEIEGDDRAADEHWSNVLNLIDTSGHYLDFEVNYSLPDDAPPKKLVRFLSIEQYISVLTARRIYFPNSREFEDPYECSFPPTFCDELTQNLISTCDEPEFSLPADVDVSPFIEECEDLLANSVVETFGSIEANRWFLSCWHAGEAETDLMWRSYGGNRGVALTCDGPALLALLSDSVTIKVGFHSDHDQEFEFVHGNVTYDDSDLLEEISMYDESPLVTVRAPAFRKHRYFRLDKEYRFAVRLPPLDSTFHQVSCALPLDACAATVSVSPLCPTWVAEAVRRLTSTYYPKVPFERINLD